MFQRAVVTALFLIQMIWWYRKFLICNPRPMDIMTADNVFYCRGYLEKRVYLCIRIYNAWIIRKIIRQRRNIKFNSSGSQIINTITTVIPSVCANRNFIIFKYFCCCFINWFLWESFCAFMTFSYFFGETPSCVMLLYLPMYQYEVTRFRTIAGLLPLFLQSHQFAPVIRPAPFHRLT